MTRVAPSTALHFVTGALCAVALVVLTAGAASAGKPAPAPVEDPHMDAGQAAFDDGDLTLAAQELKQSIAAAPSSRAWLLLGNTYLKLGQLDDARAAFEETLKLEKAGSKRVQVQKLISGIKGVKTVKMLVKSQPPGASVYVDLKAAGKRGQTPVEVLVLPGRHRIIYALDDYEEAAATPDPTAVEGSVVEVNTVLKPKGCDVSVKAQQPGVRGVVDGGERLSLPATVRVKPGKHEIALSGRGLAPKSVSIECVDFKPLSVEETLAATTTGTVQVKAEPGQSVFVDGKAVPAEEAAHLTLPAGPHEVTVEKPGGAPRREVVTVEAGETREVTPALPPPSTGPSGALVVATPADAGLWIDGKPFKAGAPVFAAPGPHQFEARANGFAAWSQQIELRPGEITRLEARLSPIKHTARTVGLVFTGLTVAAEAAAVGAYINYGIVPRGSEASNNWKAIAIAGQVTAGACMVTALAALITDAVQERKASGQTPVAPSAKVSAAAVPMPGGGSVVLSGSF